MKVIGVDAFTNLSELTYVAISSGVTAIFGGAFEDCPNLSSVTIPDTVVSIGSNAFNQCKSLTDVYYGGTRAQWNKIEISDYTYDYTYTENADEYISYAGNKPLRNATIHFIDSAEESAIVPGSIQRVPLTSGRYAAALDYSGAGLTAGIEYEIFCALYDENGKMLSVKNETVTFDNTFRANVEITDATAGTLGQIFLLTGQDLAPGSDKAQLLFI